MEQNSCGRTALHAATDLKLTEVTKYLLAQGADVNAIEKCKEWSPLHYATFNNDLEIIQLLTEAGADMECSDVNGSMPIHMTAEKGYLDIVKYIFEKGVDVDIINQDLRMTSLQLGARGGHFEVVDYLLLNNANVHFKDCKNRSSIHYGVIGGNAKSVHGLIEKGGDINAKDMFKMTPLDSA
uniref:Serine/threonine-protein phosphatase 6 regulatory ankyrin repeat subunit A-like n=1 Tax=Diabrotica virgifera virgifera TaxID=50390 RepID=A0A6P7HEK0_DIAVI